MLKGCETRPLPQLWNEPSPLNNDVLVEIKWNRNKVVLAVSLFNSTITELPRLIEKGNE